MDKIYSIGSKLITPAVILTSRATRIFIVILLQYSAGNNIQLTNRLFIAAFQTTPIVLNSGARTKERRKSRLGLSTHKNRNGPYKGGRAISGPLPAEAAATKQSEI